MSKHLRLQRSQGQFSATLYGEQGPLIVCLHGFPDNLHTFDAMIPGWVEAGYRVLTPVMRGYEPGSIQSDGDYAVTALADDVLAWLDYLGETRVFLVGHDWGAVTGWAVTARAPQRFYAYVALAIPHLGAFFSGIRSVPSQVVYSWYMSFFQLRGLADWSIRQHDWALIRLLWQRWSPGWKVPHQVMASVIETFQQPGVVSAALGYYRSLYRLWSPQGRAGMRLARQPVNVPALALAGENDGCIHPALFRHCMAPVQLAGFVEFEVLPGLGHFLHQESPDEISQAIIGFFYRWRVTGSALAQ